MDPGIQSIGRMEVRCHMAHGKSSFLFLEPHPNSISHYCCKSNPSVVLLFFPIASAKCLHSGSEFGFFFFKGLTYKVIKVNLHISLFNESVTGILFFLLVHVRLKVLERKEGEEERRKKKKTKPF